jgi:hypothetical protein
LELWLVIPMSTGGGERMSGKIANRANTFVEIA